MYRSVWRPLTVEGILYLEYQSVGPFVRIGSPAPLSRKRVYLPPWNQREGGQHSLASEGEGGHNSDDWTVYSTTLCRWQKPSSDRVNLLDDELKKSKVFSFLRKQILFVAS
jgi:hypothetical protein